jgi:hypothetical protein
MLRNVYPLPQYYIPEERKSRLHSLKNLKTCNIYKFYILPLGRAVVGKVGGRNYHKTIGLVQPIQIESYFSQDCDFQTADVQQNDALNLVFSQ